MSSKYCMPQYDDWDDEDEFMEDDWDEDDPESAVCPDCEGSGQSWDGLCECSTCGGEGYYW